MDIVVRDDGSLRLEGERVFDIREFGMQPPKILMLRVYPEVSVRVSIEATKRDDSGTTAAERRGPPCLTLSS